MEESVFIIVYVVFMIFMMLVGFAALGLWIWMLVDVIQNETDEENQKLIWVLVVILGGGVGALVYLFARRQPRRKAEGKTGLW